MRRLSFSRKAKKKAPPVPEHVPTIGLPSDVQHTMSMDIRTPRAGEDGPALRAYLPQRQPANLPPARSRETGAVARGSIGQQQHPSMAVHEILESTPGLLRKVESFRSGASGRTVGRDSLRTLPGAGGVGPMASEELMASIRGGAAAAQGPRRRSAPASQRQLPPRDAALAQIAAGGFSLRKSAAARSERSSWHARASSGDLGAVAAAAMASRRRSIADDDTPRRGEESDEEEDSDEAESPSPRPPSARVSVPPAGGPPPPPPLSRRQSSELLAATERELSQAKAELARRRSTRDEIVSRVAGVVAAAGRAALASAPSD